MGEGAGGGDTPPRVAEDRSGRGEGDGKKKEEREEIGGREVRK